MRREVLLIAEIIDADQRIVTLTSGTTIASLNQDRDRREALLWSFDRPLLSRRCDRIPVASP